MFNCYSYKDMSFVRKILDDGGKVIKYSSNNIMVEW